MGPRAGWTGRNSRLYQDSIPDRPASSQSLYRLSYPAHISRIRRLKKKSENFKVCVNDFAYNHNSCVTSIKVTLF